MINSLDQPQFPAPPPPSSSSGIVNNPQPLLDRRFDEEKLLIYRELYYDGFSSIIAARDLTTGGGVAVKKIDFRFMKTIKGAFTLHELKKRFCNKLYENTHKLSTLSSNTCILKLIEFIVEPKRLIIMTEMCIFGDFFNWILQQHHLYVKDICLMLQYLFQAVYYLHSHNCIHGNLLPTHVLFQTLSPQSVTLMLDMSIKSEIFYLTGQPSTIIYGWAPEFIRTILQSVDIMPTDSFSNNMSIDYQMNKNKEKLLQKTRMMDIWSIGVIAHIAFTGRPPYQAEQLHELLKLIDINQGKLNHPLIKSFHKTIIDKLIQLLQIDPLKRYCSFIESNNCNTSTTTTTNNNSNNDFHWWCNHDEIKNDERNLLHIIEYDMMSTCRRYRFHGRQLFEKIFLAKEQKNKNKTKNL
ncbi:unnamed protein product [Trichobilharzia szidati]|nr:unnamed protein product [Trichobilharzia szidati]